MPDYLKNHTDMQRIYGRKTFSYGWYLGAAITGEGLLVDPATGWIWAANKYRVVQAMRRGRSFCDSGRRVNVAIAPVGAGHEYGHWHHDTFACLTLWPAEVLSGACLILVAREARRPYVREMLGWILTATEIVVVEEHHWVCVDVLYDLAPRPVFLEWPAVLASLRAFADRRLRLFTSVLPARCVLMQRRGVRRVIWNMDEIRAEFMRAGPEFRFEGWTTRRHGPNFTAKDSLLFYASFRFLLGAEGSNLVPVLYMARGSVLCEVRGAGEKWYWTLASWFLGVQHVICRIAAMPHEAPTTRQTGTLDGGQVRRAAVLCVVLLRQQHFEVPGGSGSAQP